METTPLDATGESVGRPVWRRCTSGAIDRETSFDPLDRYYEVGGRFPDTATVYATRVVSDDEPTNAVG